MKVLPQKSNPFPQYHCRNCPSLQGTP